MSGDPIPDFTTWSLTRLLGQKKYLESLLAMTAGQNDPVRPQLRAEYEAVRAALGEKPEES